MGIDKAEIINQYKTSETDTGSTEVQVAILTNRIAHLTGHLKDYPKDKHTRRGLLNLISRRKRLLKYAKGRSFKNYVSLIKRLGIRH